MIEVALIISLATNALAIHTILRYKRMVVGLLEEINRISDMVTCAEENARYLNKQLAEMSS